MAQSCKNGEEVCGDDFLVKSYGNKKVLIAVVDGLGHGSSAARVSGEAVKLLENYNNESLVSLVNHCHDGLRHTRGVVMSLALIDPHEHTLTWMGVGNVDGIVLRADGDGRPKPERILFRGGIVGYQLPPLKAVIFPIYRGDVLIFCTDGVDSGYIDNVKVEDSPQEIVEQIAAGYFIDSDDSLVIAGQYTEEGVYENSN